MIDVLAQADTGAGFNILQSLQSGFTPFVNYLPQLLGALIVLLVGYLIAKVFDTIIAKGLRSTTLDQRLAANSDGRTIEQGISPDGSLSRLIGGVAFWLIMIFVITSAIDTVNIPAPTGFMSQVPAYLPNVIAALLVFIVAAAVAGAVGAMVHRTMGDTPTGKVVRAAVPVLIMARRCS